MYLKTSGNLINGSPDRAMLYLSLRLLMEGLLQRQQQMQCAENYSVRNSLGKLLRLHRSMSLKLVDVLHLDMRYVGYWPSVNQVVTVLPQAVKTEHDSIHQQLRFTLDAPTAAEAEKLGRNERIMLRWLTFVSRYCHAPRLKALVADMIAAWQVCLEGISSELLTSHSR